MFGKNFSLNSNAMRELRGIMPTFAARDDADMLRKALALAKVMAQSADEHNSVRIILPDGQERRVNLDR